MNAPIVTCDRMWSTKLHDQSEDDITRFTSMLKDLLYKFLPVGERFRRIYKRNQWGSGESVSGPGSTRLYTANLVKYINTLVNTLNLRSVVDVPCGDFNWMKAVLSDNKIIENYIGLDIVEDLIEKNSINAVENYISFQTFDILKDIPPAADLVIVRDLLIHFSHRDGLRALSNIKKSNSAYLLSTTYPDVRENKNIITGRWTLINLSLPPYNLPSPPIDLFEESANERKCIGLWKIADIPK